MQCAGDDTYGQLGTGDTALHNAGYVPAGTDVDWAQVSVGAAYGGCRELPRRVGRRVDWLNMHFTMTNEIDCNVEKFWETFLDPKLTERLFKEALGFTEFRILEQTETASTLLRRSAATPKMSWPGPVAKLFGDRFGYTEEATFDKATKVWSWKMTPSTLPDKLRHEGSVRVEPIGDARVRRIVAIVLEAKVFAIGGLIESSVEKQIRESWEKSAAVTNEWLRAPPI